MASKHRVKAICTAQFSTGVTSYAVDECMFAAWTSFATAIRQVKMCTGMCLGTKRDFFACVLWPLVCILGKACF